MTDHTPDFYKMMDRVGLTAAEINGTRIPLQTLINKIRTKLAGELQTYVEKVEEK